MKAVRVRWRDSARANSVWMSPESAIKVTPSKCESVGYVVHDDGKSLVLAGSVDRYGNFGEVHVIPRSCVVKMKRV